jgi:hypothetical protein
MAAAGVTTGDDTDAAAAFYNAQSTLRAGKRSAGTTGTPQRRAQGGSRKAFWCEAFLLFLNAPTDLQVTLFAQGYRYRTDLHIASFKPYEYTK